MSDEIRDIMAALAAPFPPGVEKSRVGSGGRQLRYVDARAVIHRLDEVLGPQNWWDDYQMFGNVSVKCLLSVRFPDGTVVTKAGIGGITNMPDESDTEKTGESDAIKRACVKFGIGAYLYGGDKPTGQAAQRPAGAAAGPRTASQPSGRPSTAPTQSRPPRGNSGDSGDPTTGRHLFKWIKDTEQGNNLAILEEVQKVGKDAGYPDRIVDWPEEAVTWAVGYVKWVVDGRPEAPAKASRSDEVNLNQLRNKLRAKIRMICGTPPGAKVEAKQEGVALTDISNYCNGELITDIEAEADANLLSRAIEGAEQILADMATAR